MRYTTIIDIREKARIYRNTNARLLYLHLVLESGYHDDDRDLTRLSLRSMAAQTGLTLSATRHALKILQSEGLAIHEGEAWRIVKFILDKKPTPRRQATVGTFTTSEDPAADERKRRMKVTKDALGRCTLDELKQWVQELENGVYRSHYGVVIPAGDEGIFVAKTFLKLKLKEHDRT